MIKLVKSNIRKDRAVLTVFLLIIILSAMLTDVITLKGFLNCFFISPPPCCKKIYQDL